jgi:hypothetical protein
MPIRQHSIKLEDSSANLLASLAKFKGVSQSEVIKEALDIMINRDAVIRDLHANISEINLSLEIMAKYIKDKELRNAI